jgi:hypothetical protein
MLSEQHQPGSIRRRDVLRGMIGGGAMMALSPSLVHQAEAHDSDCTLPQTITEATKLIRTRQVSVTELTTAYLECAKQFEPILNTFITRNCGTGVAVGPYMAFPSSTKTTSIRRGF